MNKGIFAFWLFIGMGLISALIPARAQGVRVAVAGDSSLANLVDVTTAELSKQPGLTVLDRASLDKLGQEQELKAVLDAKDFAPVRLLPADGLILLRAVMADGKTSVFARLVAIQPGVVLREVALPDSADPLAQGQALEKEFAPYWPKLAAIQKGKITALSLLGLRFEVDAPETRDLERSINLLLASRLSAEPDVVVLERWRLNDAVFEKTLSPQPDSSFWTGSSLIDGSMRMKDGHVEVTLRMRPPQGPALSISEQDTPDNLPALVERLAGKIHDQPLAPGAWKPGDEANHFAQLGKWGLDNRLFEQGAEAIESAMALGDTSRTTHMLQVKAYAMEAYPDNLQVVDEDYNTINVKITPDSLPQRLAAAARAASLGQDYLKANRDFSTPTWNLEDPSYLCLPVLNNCLRTLRAAYENGFQKDHGDEVAGARHEIQKLVAGMDDFLREKPSRDSRGYFFSCRLRYAGLWHEKPEDTLAFYRELTNSPADNRRMCAELFDEGAAPPYLDGEGAPALTSPHLLKSPWIVAWNNDSSTDLPTTWRNFVKELAASPDLVQEADSLKFEFHSSRTQAGRDDVMTRTVAFLKQHSEAIYGPRGEDFVTGFSDILSSAKANPACWNDVLNLYISLFKEHVPLPSSWVYATSVVVDAKMPPDTAKDLSVALNDYALWYQSQTPQDYSVLEALARVQQTIYRDRPELTPAPVAVQATDALVVHQAWDNQNKVDAINGPKQSQPLAINFRTLTYAENKIWFMEVGVSPTQIVCLDPANWQIVSKETVPAQFEPPKHSPMEYRARYIAVTPQWLVFSYAGQVLLCSRTDHQWHALDLPPSTYKPRWVNQELYLLYEAEYGAVLQRLYTNGAASIGSGLIHVSLPDEKIENLVSSRRVPPQNALDGTLLGHPSDLWLSKTGLTLAVDANSTPHFQVYASPVGKNEWTSVATDLLPCVIKAAANGAVIGHRFNQRTFSEITLMNEKADEVLLANPDQANVNGPVQPVWNFPDELRNTPPGEVSDTGFAMRGDDLCLSHNTVGGVGVADHSGTGTLYYFARGQKQGIKIPLAFDVTQVKGQGFVAADSLQAIDTGLIFHGAGSSQGFWFIPWSDIDASRAKAKPNSTP